MSKVILFCIVFGLLGCGAPQSENTSDDEEVHLVGSPDPIPVPPPPELAEQAPSCVVRESSFSSDESFPALLGAVELICNTRITGYTTSASSDGTRHIAFRLADEFAFHQHRRPPRRHPPASVGLWTEPADPRDTVRVLPVLGGFPALMADSSGTAHMVRIESGAAVYYRCDARDPAEWSRELVKSLSNDEYPSDIAVDGEGRPRVLIQQRTGEFFIAQRESDARWRGHSRNVSIGVITSRLGVEPDGGEHVVFWSIGRSLRLCSEGSCSHSNPVTAGVGLSLRLIDMPESSKMRPVVAFKGALTPYKIRDGAHVFVPAHGGGTIDTLQQLPAKANGETCSPAKGRVKRCERRIASMSEPTIATTEDGWIWAVHASTLRVDQVEIELPEEEPRPGKTKRPPHIPLRETNLDSEAIQRLSLTRISVVDGSAEVRMRLDREVVSGRSMIAPRIEAVGEELHVVFKSARNTLTLLRIDPSATKVVALPETSPERYELLRPEPQEE